MVTVMGGKASMRPSDGASPVTTGKAHYRGAGVGRGVQGDCVPTETEARSSAEGKHGEEGLEVDERVRHAFQESWRRMTRAKAGLPTRLTGSPVAHDAI